MAVSGVVVVRDMRDDTFDAALSENIVRVSQQKLAQASTPRVGSDEYFAAVHERVSSYDGSDARCYWHHSTGVPRICCQSFPIVETDTVVSPFPCAGEKFCTEIKAAEFLLWTLL